MRRPRAYGWWRYTSARQAGWLAILSLLPAAVVIDTAFTTQAGPGYALVACIPLYSAAFWASQWKRARQNPELTGREVSPSIPTPETTGGRSALALRLLALVFESPGNAAIYGLVVALGPALMATAIFAIVRATSGSPSVGLVPALAGILAVGPIGGLIAYYAMPKEVRDRFRR